MAVYHKFGPADVVHYSLSTSPKTELASGSSGWKGNTGTNGTLSIYGGIRALERSMSADGISIQPVINLPAYSADGTIELTGSYPHTGSVDWVKCRNSALASTTQYDWGEEHFKPIMNLYDYYERFDYDYNTGSYDFYCLYSQPTSDNAVEYADSATYDFMSSSYAIEARIKPLSITGSAHNRTLIARGDLWSFYIDQTTGNLAFSASDGSGVIYTSSFAPTNNRWSHVAYSVNESVGSFLINMVDGGQYNITGSIDAGSDVIRVFADSTGSSTFHGFAHDVKVWKAGRTYAQLSASHASVLTSSGSEADLMLYGRFNDGPLMTFDAITAGSGAFDHSLTANHGTMVKYDERCAPGWHPCDDVGYTAQKTRVTSSIDFIRLLHVPSLYYGRQMATGSVKLVCNTYLSSSIKRTLVDDGRGGLYISGSVSSASLENAEHYKGVEWPKVGNVFYSEGLVVIKDPSLFDFGDYVMGGETSPMASDVLQVSFKGTQNIPTKVMMCRINGAASNASNNETFTSRNADTGKLDVVRSSPITYVTAVGIYNEERKLVAVAKLAQPVRNRERDKINIRLKCDF